MAKLAQLYLSQLNASGDTRADDNTLVELDQALRTSLDIARETWSGLQLDEAEVVTYFAERAAPGNNPHEAFEALNSIDLYLACGCAQENEQAVTLFRDHTRDVIRSTVARHGSGSYIDEVEQQLFTRLLVAGHSGRPDIHKFNGSGQLLAWLRVAATRESLNTLRKRQPKPRDDIELLVERAIEHSEPELEMLKQKYRTEFRSVFARAFEELDDRGRSVLRFQYIEGLNLEEMALILSVGRSTVARWRATARVQLFEATKRIFTEEHKISGSEFTSIMRLIGSQLDASVQRLLKQKASGD